MDPHEVAAGVLRLLNETLCLPVQSSDASALEPPLSSAFAFGITSQHACSTAVVKVFGTMSKSLEGTKNVP